MDLQKAANKAANKEWRKASKAYRKGDYDALDYGYDKAYDAALVVVHARGVYGDQAHIYATKAASAGEGKLWGSRPRSSQRLTRPQIGPVCAARVTGKPSATLTASTRGWARSRRKSRASYARRDTSNQAPQDAAHPDHGRTEAQATAVRHRTKSSHGHETGRQRQKAALCH
jgi:hypothetical protein